MNMYFNRISIEYEYVLPLSICNSHFPIEMSRCSPPVPASFGLVPGGLRSGQQHLLRFAERRRQRSRRCETNAAVQRCAGSRASVSRKRCGEELMCFLHEFLMFYMGFIEFFSFSRPFLWVWYGSTSGTVPVSILKIAIYSGFSH